MRYVTPKRRSAYGPHGARDWRSGARGTVLGRYVPPKRRPAYGLHGALSVAARRLGTPADTFLRNVGVHMAHTAQ